MNIKVDRDRFLSELFGLMFNDDPYEMLIPASDPEIDDLTKKENMKAGGNRRRGRRETRP